MGVLRLRKGHPEWGIGVMPAARLESLDAASVDGTAVRSGAVVREMGRSLALLAVTGLSVGGGLSMVVVAFHHTLGR